MTITEFINKYGTTGASFVIRQASFRLEDNDMSDEQKLGIAKKLGIAEALRKIAEDLESALTKSGM